MFYKNKNNQLVIIVEQIEYSILRDFENSIPNINVRVGGYEMDSICPINEGKCYKIKLQESDLNRLFILGDPSFTNLTSNKNYRLSGLIPEVAEQEIKTRTSLDVILDLRESHKLAPVFVSRNLDSGLVVTIDGNHRLMGHFLRNKSIEGVNGFLFVHPNVEKWGFIETIKKALIKKL